MRGTRGIMLKTVAKSVGSLALCLTLTSCALPKWSIYTPSPEIMNIKHALSEGDAEAFLNEFFLTHGKPYPPPMAIMVKADRKVYMTPDSFYQQQTGGLPLVAPGLLVGGVITKDLVTVKRAEVALIRVILAHGGKRETDIRIDLCTRDEMTSYGRMVQFVCPREHMNKVIAALSVVCAQAKLRALDFE